MSDDLRRYEKQYLVALSRNQLEEAKESLLSVILIAKQMNARPVLAGFVQNLGSVLFKQGDLLSANILYEISEELDSGSLLAKLHYAKFLLNEVNDKDKAIEKCKEIITSAINSPFPETDDDFSSTEYCEAAERVICAAQNGQVAFP